MATFSRLNKQVVPILLRTLAWLLFVALLPAAIYGFTEGLWAGLKVFLVIGAVSALGLILGFWGALFPKQSGGG